jgi:hypothetical protein
VLLADLICVADRLDLCVFRYVPRYSDPVMATGWHMIMGGVLLRGLALQKDPAAITEALQGLGPQVCTFSGLIVNKKMCDCARWLCSEREVRVEVRFGGLIVF